jgi:hypothetical protein
MFEFGLFFCILLPYNVKAFSSLMGETFFSDLTNDDKRGQGTVTTDEFSSSVGNAVEQKSLP